MKKITLFLVFIFTSFLLVGCMDKKIKYDPNDVYVIFYSNVNEKVRALDTKEHPRPKRQMLKKGSKVSKPQDPFALGSHFEGWFKDQEYTTLWDFEKDTVSESITLYAKWRAGVYSVKYHFNLGGNFVPNANNFSQYKAGDDINLPDAEREQSKFLGWYPIDYKEEEPIDIAKRITSTKDHYKNLELYAIFEYKAYRLDYYLDTNKYGGVIKPKYNSKIAKLPKNPKKLGKTFVGWFLKNAAGEWDEEVTNETIYKWTTDIKVYAKWA